MVIERQRKSDREDQKNGDDDSIDVVPKRNGRKVGQQNHCFCSDDIRQDSADKKPFLAIE